MGRITRKEACEIARKISEDAQKARDKDWEESLEKTFDDYCRDDPDLDGTDFAHPAWWRGHDYALRLFCQKVNDILDGKDDCSGVCQEPWESTRKRIYAKKVHHQTD